MKRGKKKIKLDLEIVKEEPQQEEEDAEGEDGVYSFEEVLMEEHIELEPEHFFMKEEVEVEQMEEDEEETEENAHKMSDCNKSLFIEDGAESVKNNKPTTTVRDFMCTICNYATKKPIDFTIHWLGHEKQSYTNENGVFVCQISDCFYVAPNQEDLLKHIASQHLHRYRCHFCYYMTYWKNDYDQHRNTHYTYQCVKCDLQSTKLFFVQDHVETPFKCKICDFASYHWFLHKKHMNWHKYPPDSIIECGFCDFTTGHQALLKMHEVVHRTKFVLCKMCRFTGANIAELAQHCKKNHDTTLEAVDKLHKCKFCTCKFIGLGSKEKHEELHLKSGASLKCCSNSTHIQCPYCEHLENQRDDMNMHILSNHAAALELDGFRFENTSDEIALVFKDLEACDVYNKDYEENQDKRGAEQDVNTEDYEENQDKHAFEQDVNTEDATKYQEKRVVNDDIAEDDDLEENHVNKTHKIIWRCPICPHLSKGKPDFNRHLITKHTMSHTEANTKSKHTFSCAICQFTTTDKGSYYSHFSVHRTNEIMPTEQELETETPRHTCSFCYYTTSSQEDYDRHCEQHTTFKCTKCPIESTKRLFVEDHIENPWGCAKCNFKTHHWLPMKIHSFSHQTLTLLKCNECDFETKRLAVLKTHWLQHSSTLLRCKICLFKTRCQNSLEIHYAEHHDGMPLDDGSIPSNNRPYECDLCACKFKQQVYLDKHRTLHGENGPFRSRCSQCHQSKNTSKIVENKISSKKEDKSNSWSTCPYCSYQDDVRYRMIEHLTHIHQKELETEGYRFDDGQKEEIIPQSATSIESPAATMMSYAPVIQMQDTTDPDNTREDEDTIYTEQNEDIEGGMYTEENTMMSRNVPKDTSGSNQTQYLDPSTGYMLDQEPEYIHNQGNEIVIDQQKNEADDDAIIKHEEDTQSDGNVFQTIYIEEEGIYNNHRPIEKITIKVEPIPLAEEDSPKYLTSKRNTACSHSGGMYQHQTETKYTSELVATYSETDGRWHCNVCPYIAMRKHFVEQHIDQMHMGGQKIIWHCKMCPYRSTAEANLKQHVAMMHKAEYGQKAASEEIPCKQPGCDFKAPSVDELSTHMARHLQTSMQEVMFYKCDRCSFRSVSKKIFRKHTKSCNDPIWYNCYNCDFRSESKKGILTHMESKHQYRYIFKKGYECRKCGYSSKEKYWRRNHYAHCEARGKVKH